MKNNIPFTPPANPHGCQHVAHNISLVRSREAKNYLHAMGMVRTFFCGCRKCHPLKKYAGE